MTSTIPNPNPIRVGMRVRSVPNAFTYIPAGRVLAVATLGRTLCATVYVPEFKTIWRDVPVASLLRVR